MKRKHLLILLSSLIVASIFMSAPVDAAKYTKSEARLVKQYQTSYHKLDKTIYDQNTLFVVAPRFASPFQPGQLQTSYIRTSMAYLNYYRSLFNLPAEANYPEDNLNAQLGASALAAVNAQTSLHAHGLLGYQRPAYISSNDWNAAEMATLGNINFLESPTNSAGEIVTDLLKDQNNLAGVGNTGHRALILSAKATHMGIGAAYGKDSHKFYSVENGLFAADILRTPIKTTIAYPSKKLFPYELLKGDTPWSVYFTSRHVNKKPKIYITDLSTKKKKKYKAHHVQLFGTDYFSEGYAGAITYRPSHHLKLVNTHKYHLQIGKLYTYTFKLFREEK